MEKDFEVIVHLNKMLGLPTFGAYGERGDTRVDSGHVHHKI